MTAKKIYRFKWRIEMNNALLTMIGFVCGIGFWMQYSTPNHTVEESIVLAYQMGIDECPEDVVCMDRGPMPKLQRLSVDDIENVL